jgi:PKD repeat protein
MRFGWTTGGGHFLVGYGYDQNGAYLDYMDPWPGRGDTKSLYSWVVHASDHDWTHTLQFTTNVPRITVSPSSYDFGSQATSTTQTFTVSNPSLENLTINTISIGGANSSEFSKGYDACSGNTIAPSGSCTVQVVFSPVSPEAKSAELIIPSNDPNTPTLNIPLSGTGVVTLTIVKTGTGSGTVTSSPAGIDCGQDCTEQYSVITTVTLTAAASADSSFAGWSGGGCSGTGNCTVAMDANTTVTATFNMLPPVANFSASPTTAYAPLTVTFPDLSSNNPASWFWDFGDGSTSTTQNPVHIYANPGTYSVSLTVTNAGGTSNKTMTNYIAALPCYNPPARIAGATPSYYSTIQAAYDAAVDGDIIQSLGVDFAENLGINRNISIDLQGGYDCNYASAVTNTTLKGMVTTTSGTLTIKNFILQK